ncbi:transposase [Streptomyces sp. NPDC058256]|uniref:transposase n=1 Tax=Streptomyces sp. NPDC058256 TaxID=3346408 RepID=UPI0036E98A51
MDRWHVGFVDLSGKQGLLGQVEGRTAQAVIDWLADREQAWRDAVQYVAIDMCTIFKPAIRRVLPQAPLVVDHFHLVQPANQTLTEVRRRVTVTHRGRRGRKGNREWELRNRLTRPAARMRGEHVDALLDELSNLSRVIGAPITVAWNAKEDLLDLLATARTRPDREHVRDLLHRFYRRCADAGLPELQRLATTVETWWQPGHQDHRPRRLRLPQPRQPALTHPLRDHPSSPWTPRCPPISLSPHPAVVLASGTKLSVPQASAWL